MSKVCLTVELPVSAETAAGLARKPQMIRFVLGPILRAPGLTAPERLEVGTRASARLWWFGVIPSWTHHLMIEKLDPTEILTREHGGPVRTWNHRLTFAPLDEGRCRYTDEIETDDGLSGFVTRLFIRVLFRHRHRRWLLLTDILAPGR
jgi:ligand-binding SRPBCC domain-containing protein